MNDDGHATVREPRRLASIFDDIPPNTPLSLDELEAAMNCDIERRCLAALDRALARLAAHSLLPLHILRTPVRPPTGSTGRYPDE